MSDYRYSQVENQLNGTPYGEIDLIKLSKLDKLLTKIDNDFKKKQKDITKPKLVEIMKTTHEIYQIVLYEISEMLEAARLSDLRQSLNKIYNGQNLILNYILKLNTNFEVQADKMLEQLSKQVGQPRRKSVDQGEQDQKETSKMANQMVQLQPIVKKMIRKTFGEKATDTGDDMREARSFENLQKKQQELNLLQEEADEEGKQLAEFLKNRKVDLMSIGESKAQNNLKEVLKDLGKKKRQTNDIEEEALGFEEQQKDQLQQFNQLQGTLMDGLKGMQKQQQEKAMADIKSGKALMKNGVLVLLNYVYSQVQLSGQPLVLFQAIKSLSRVSSLSPEELQPFIKIFFQHLQQSQNIIYSALRIMYLLVHYQNRILIIENNQNDWLSYFKCQTSNHHASVSRLGFMNLFQIWKSDEVAQNMQCIYQAYKFRNSKINFMQDYMNQQQCAAMKENKLQNSLILYQRIQKRNNFWIQLLKDILSIEKHIRSFLLLVLDRPINIISFAVSIIYQILYNKIYSEENQRKIYQDFRYYLQRYYYNRPVEVNSRKMNENSVVEEIIR